ncbi:hypothetical protein [Flavobacterium pallidum]|uniref:hypothetical protein n=1 Tax=Flavobacterium pallidum TaxID=2172098 RepID=UPI0011B20807|nr:hypothetical protein [Flavobacterium pallidum]
MDSFEQFLKYNYFETKDLCLHFLTLVTAVLVFSLNFAEKVFNFKEASGKRRSIIISGWCSFIFSIIFCGVGLALNSRAGGYALSKELNQLNCYSFWAYIFISLSGCLFILGLILTMVSAITTRDVTFKPEN